jgi:tetratricopeptide (TPR) repeat protein
MGKEDKYEEDFETYKLKSEVDNSKEILEEASKLIKNGKRNEALNKIENALIDFTIINPFMNRSSYLLYFEASQICIENPEKALNLLSKIEEENDNLNELRYLTRSELFAKQIVAKKYKESYLTLIEMELDLNSNKKLNNKDKKIADLILDKKYFYSDMIFNDFKKHNFKNTLSKIDKLVELDKDDIEPIHMRGYALFYLGKRNEGIQLVKKYVKLKPKAANAYYNLACFYSILGKKDLSLKNLKISITMDSKLKENAKKDKDFDNVKNLKEFKSLVI